MLGALVEHRGAHLEPAELLREAGDLTEFDCAVSDAIADPPEQPRELKRACLLLSDRIDVTAVEVSAVVRR
jgi:hypothetical protein